MINNRKTDYKLIFTKLRGGAQSLDQLLSYDPSELSLDEIKTKIKKLENELEQIPIKISETEGYLTDPDNIRLGFTQFFQQMLDILRGRPSEINKELMSLNDAYKVKLSAGRLDAQLQQAIEKRKQNMKKPDEYDGEGKGGSAEGGSAV